MKLDFLTIKTVEEAKENLKRLAEKNPLGKEEVALKKALGRRLGTDLYSKVNLPSFNRSTVDGYALYCQDAFGASESIPAILSLKGEVEMGQDIEKSLERGEAIYVPTGGMVPKGTEAMVMLEYTEKMDEETLLVYKPVSPKQHMSFIGDDLEVGEKVFERGRKLSPYDIGLLAGMNIEKVEVFKGPQVAILSTGDEVVDVGKPLEGAQIRDINGYALAAFVESLGCEVTYQSIVKDDFEKLQEAMDEAIEKSQLVLLSGGSSVGAKDYTKKLIESYEEGEVFLHGLAIKPGKPTLLGTIGTLPVFGLPGHPVSALMVCQQTVKIYLEALMEQEEKEVYLWASLMANVHGSPGKTTYQTVCLYQGENGWKAEPLYGKSGMMTLLTKGTGYFVIEEDKEGYEQGALVKVYLLREGRL